MQGHADLRRGLRFFWEAAVELQKCQAKLHRDSEFYMTPDFARRFNALKFPADPELKLPPDLRSRLREVAYSEKFWKCWRQERVSDESEEYICDTPSGHFRDVSICEAAEVKRQQSGSDVGILSAEDSAFAGVQRLNLTKTRSAEQVQLHNTALMHSVRQWITQQRGYYDPASRTAPKDFQTVLEGDAERFERTNHFWNVAGVDRRIFREIETGRYFYVDEGHPGLSAHLEVFDAQKKHVGEADISTGAVDTSKRVEGREIWF